MNILVTGGTGFIGKNFVPLLLQENHKVYLLVRNIEKAKKIFEDKVEYIIGDIQDRNSLKGCCKNIDIVYHMVAKVGNDLPNSKVYDEFFKINVEGTKNIVSEAKKSNVKRFIYVSSIAAMGIVKDKIITEESICNPYLPYQKTKYEAEKYLLKEYEENSFPVIIIRPTKVYGIGEPEYSFLTQMKLCKKGINLIIGMGKNYISNICISDFVCGLMKCLKNGNFGRIYILSGKDSISAKEITKILSQKMDKRIMNIRIPKSIMVACSFIEERFFLLIHKKPIVTVRNIKALSKDRIYDLNKSLIELDYNPQISMEDGMLMMFDWYKKEKLI